MHRAAVQTRIASYPGSSSHSRPASAFPFDKNRHLESSDYFPAQPRDMAMVGAEEMRERKRRYERGDREMDMAVGRYNSRSPPNRKYDRDDGAFRSGNGHLSPHNQLPPMSNMAHDEEDGASKRRRLEAADGMHGRTSDAYRAAEAGYAEEEFRRANARGGLRNGGGYADERYGAPLHSSERRSIGEESFDSTIPLARRRGDAAQAKASRLHIDTGFGGEGGPGLDAGHNRLPSQPPLHGARSAPPYKASFSERDGAPFDPRGEPPPRGYAPGGPIGAPAAHMATGYGRREGPDGSHALNDRPGTPHRREPLHTSGPSAAPQSAYRGAGSTLATPLTATRGVFVPQTATLPSPAYHTTQFVRQAGGGAPAPGTSTGNGAGPVQAGPRTAGLNPPQTARLPDHLRSPPSNKTQFLALFSNFYDSLQDSRTLKATLEDQVRRSNTLLQTLQRSARVLELTVERRLNAERSVWESKVQALEERCQRLERRTGAGSPTPSEGDDETGSGKEGNSNTAGDVATETDRRAENGEDAKVREEPGAEPADSEVADAEGGTSKKD